MDRKEKIQALLQQCCEEVVAYVKERESLYADGYVPAVDLNNGLGINFSAVPKNSTNPSGQRGWLFATFARMLEDEGRLKYQKKGSRVFYKRVADKVA